jgi:hypothetical protein
MEARDLSFEKSLVVHCQQGVNGQIAGMSFRNLSQQLPVY